MTTPDRLLCIGLAMLLLAAAGLLAIRAGELSDAVAHLAVEEAARTRALDRIADECRP